MKNILLLCSFVLAGAPSVGGQDIAPHAWNQLPPLPRPAVAPLTPSMPAMAAALAPAPAIAGSAFTYGASAPFARAFDSRPENWSQISNVIPAPVLPLPRNDSRDDPADSLYRAGRSALTDGNFSLAQTVFKQLTDKYPDSELAADAMYYRAYSLYKMGNSSGLEQAVTLLDRQAIRYPRAATLSDAKLLRATILTEQAKRGDGRAAFEIQGAVSNLKASSKCSDDDDMYLTALQSLVQQDPDQVLPVLQKVLGRTDECSIRMRKRAVYMLAQTKEEERADILLHVASVDPSVDVRREAVQWLSAVNTERAVKALDSILFTAKDAEIRDRALSALSNHRSASARQALRRFAEQTTISTELRSRAITQIGGGRKTPEDVEFLKRLFTKTASPELKTSIIESLSYWQSMGQGDSAMRAQSMPDRTAWLLEVARNKNEEIEIRKKALFGASRAGLDAKTLFGLYDEMAGQTEMQDQLLYVYNQRKEPEAVDRLMQIVRTEKNPVLRRKAITWLGSKKDPRVAKFLLELIGQ